MGKGKAVRSGTLLLVSIVILLASCQKENDNTQPVAQKPKVGTTWIYSYYIYNPQGGVISSKFLTWKAVAQETIAGESWLRINELVVDTTVYLLREKTGGLYQYDNSSAQLFCKNPANTGDTYSSFYRDTTLAFTVSMAAFTYGSNVGDVKTNFYEARRNGNLTDEFWFNENAWILRQQSYRKPLFGSYYKYTAHFIQSITY